MCGGGPGKVLDNIKGQAKEAFSSDGIRRNLTTGGLSTGGQLIENGMDLDSMGRKNLTHETREKGIIPDKKVKVDPEAERAKAAADSTLSANMRISMQRKAMRDNSLFTGGGARKTLGV